MTNYKAEDARDAVRKRLKDETLLTIFDKNGLPYYDPRKSEELAIEGIVDEISSRLTDRIKRVIKIELNYLRRDLKVDAERRDKAECEREDEIKRRNEAEDRFELERRFQFK